MLHDFCGMYKDVDNVRMSEYVVYRFCRVPFGMVYSSFLLAGMVKFRLKQFGTPVSKANMSLELLVTRLPISYVVSCIT